MILTRSSVAAISNEHKTKINNGLKAMSEALQDISVSELIFDRHVDLHELFRIYQQLSVLTRSVAEAMISSEDVAILFQKTGKTAHRNCLGNKRAAYEM